MRPGRLVTRSLVFHARAHAATLGGVLIASGVLTGALALGDSVRASLARAARQRSGTIAAVLGNGERFFLSALTERLAAALPGVPVAAAIQLPAVAATADGERRVGDAQLLGVDAGFFAFAPEGQGTGLPGSDEAWVGSELARRLAVGPGDALVLRVPRPSGMTRELALVSVEEAIVPLRVRVTRVLAAQEFGAFSLEAGAGPRANLFVAREWLAARLAVPGRANRAFLGPAGAEAPAEADGEGEATLAAVRGALGAAWVLEDVGLAWRARDGARELVSDQVFLADGLIAALEPLDPPALGLLGYFVNAIAKGARLTPYSTVVALGGLGARPAADLGGWREALGGELGPDEIRINDWTAADLEAHVGDELTLRYFALGPGRGLVERSQALRLGAILPTAGIGADPDLAPELPGIGDAENCRDWDPGIPIDLDALRDEDEAYWDAHRGAPKAFLSLATARALFGNRYGSFTGVRVAPAQVAEAERRLREVDAGSLGLAVRAVSARATGTSDFGGLFLGLSFFAIASALILTALFFAFSIERRASELGVLRVCGFRAGEVVRLQLAEAGLLCGLGSGLGLPLGLGYTRLLLLGLERAWSGAVGRTELVFACTPGTLALAFVLSASLGLGAVAWVLRRARRASVLPLLFGQLEAEGSGAASRARGRRAVLLLGGLGALACLGGAFASQGAAAGALAFGAGFAALVAGLAGMRELLARRARPRSLVSLGWTNAARRPGRSLTTVALTASSIFLLVVAGASRQGPTPVSAGRASGTGGFAFLGRTSLPVLHDLRTSVGRDFYGLSEEDLAGVEIAALRVRAGDEASCLNLDQPRSPRLLGVRAADLAGRFRFAASTAPAADPWALLEEDLGPGVVPAVVDAISLQWTLHKALGDELELVDGQGRPFRARVVATLQDSILQGDVLIAEARFEALFPAEAGHRAFLIDAPAGRAEALAKRLARVLADEGLELVPAHERLDLLHGVQNTYLAIFQALGGFGLVLGSVGLLALVLRSAIERRGELALLRALGFTRAELRLLFLGEQGGLVWSGLLVGAFAGLCVVLPRLDASSFEALRTLAAVLLAVGLSGLLWVGLGVTPALHGSALEALNRE